MPSRSKLCDGNQQFDDIPTWKNAVPYDKATAYDLTIYLYILGSDVLYAALNDQYIYIYVNIFIYLIMHAQSLFKIKGPDNPTR